MRIKKSQLKELVRQSIYDEIQEGGPGSGRPKEDDVQTLDPSTDPDYRGEWDKHAMSAADAANKKMDAAEKAAKKKKKKVKESKGRRTTVKEVRKWMKTLEENRYKKTYNSDCRRVSWLVNNQMTEDYESMPISMKKKWPKAAYQRERYLAKEYIKHLKSQQMNEGKLENKLRELIREVIKKELKEGPAKYGHRWEIPTKYKKKVQTIVKKLKVPSKDYAIYGTGKTFEMEISAGKLADKVLELLIKNKIKVQDV